MRKRNQIAGQFIAHPKQMVESPAWRALSLAARKALDRIEIEHMNHGGAENGKLIGRERPREHVSDVDHPDAFEGADLSVIEHGAYLLVAGGGDIVVGDAPPDAKGWKIGIAPLENPTTKASRYLSLTNAAVSTSGDTEQYVEIGGKRYSHIVDP